MRAHLYSPKKGKMRVVGLASGSGKSLLTVIEQQKELDASKGSPYEVVAIFTDNPKSKAREIGEQFDIPVILHDIRAFYAERGAKITDMTVRQTFDLETVKALAPYNAHVALYAGYVWAATAPLVNAFLGINVHPADLSIENDGKRAYAGAHGVRDALLAGEKMLASTAHLVTTEIDGGPILMISKPIAVDWGKRSLEELEKECLNLLNREARRLFPKVVKAVAEGDFEIDEDGLLYYMGLPIPKGYREI
ncbi:MAG: phosphoribosylglycinamide formyltransferase [Thermodesulfobacteriota bacterium]